MTGSLSHGSHSLTDDSSAPGSIGRGQGATGDTVRARVPTPSPSPPEVPLVEAVETVEVVEVADLVEVSSQDVPVPRSEVATVPELAADEKPEPVPARVDPPAVSGEVSISEPEPLGMFDPRPPRAEPAEPAGPVPAPLRDEPPAVSGEVSIEVTPTAEPAPPAVGSVSVTSSGSMPVLQPSMMQSSGHHPVLNPATFGQRPGTDPGTYGGVVLSETTGPQPVAQGEITGPHSVMRGSARRGRPDRTLWYVALALVVLAVGGVVLVVSRAAG